MEVPVATVGDRNKRKGKRTSEAKTDGPKLVPKLVSLSNVFMQMNTWSLLVTFIYPETVD